MVIGRMIISCSSLGVGTLLSSSYVDIYLIQKRNGHIRQYDHEYKVSPSIGHLSWHSIRFPIFMLKLCHIICPETVSCI
jgi:hypothetical protein